MTNSRLLTSLFSVLFGVSVLGYGTAAVAARHPAQGRRAHYFSLIAATPTGYQALQADSQKPKAVEPLPDGKGKDVTKRVCSGCHAVTVFSQQRHTPDQWASIVESMMAKGLDATDDELTTITDYLSTNLPAPKQTAPATTSPESPSR